MTFEEHRGPIAGKTVAWTGDDNNVLASWAHAAERFKFQLNVATPPELAPKKAMRDWIKETSAPIMAGRRRGCRDRVACARCGARAGRASGRTQRRQG